MLPEPPLTSARYRRRRLLLGATILALAAISAVVIVNRAPAQSATEELQSKLDQYQHVTEQQGDVQASIEDLNAQVNDLIARESAVRRQLAPVEAELAQKQADLDEATAALNAEKEHLVKVRAHLDRAVAALEELLVTIYKTGDQDTASVVLDSTSWSDLIARSEYMDSIKDADDAVVDRVRALEDEITEIVGQLTDSRARIKEARDAIAERKAELDKIKDQIESQHAELSAAKAAREQTLASLGAQQQALEKDLSQSGLPLPGQQAKLLPNGDAVPPVNAPLEVRAVIEAANRINDLPYVWGGGHGAWEDSGYDCSGSVSYALHGGGLLDSPLDSTGLEFWGEPGPGNWISIFATSGHVYAFIAGLRWDTGGNGGGFGPRWHADLRDTTGYVARHPAGL
jgi:peptidoglycan hydrolase CwlO-like protein